MADALLQIERQKVKKEIALKKESIQSDIKLKQLEHSHETEVLELKAISGVSVLGSDMPKPKGPKLPAFEEGKDEMDS